MKLAIIALAPSYPIGALNGIRARWPSVDLATVPIITFYGYSWDGLLFDIPRHIAWKDLPLRCPVARRESRSIGFRTGIEGPNNNDNTPAMLRPILMQADEILLLCPEDFEAIGAANDFLHDVFGSVPKGRIIYPMDLFAWNRDRNTNNIRTMLEAGFFEDVASEAIATAEISNYFDFNYVLNATPILGLAARRSGLDGAAPSAFGLQLLYWMRDHTSEIKISDLDYDVMRHWKGLEKYADGKGMGSCRSRRAIVERLVRGGYLSCDGVTNAVQLTEAGRTFLSLLHKDCRDPDLPFRLRKWASLPRRTAKSRIDGYINAFFGKQTRVTGHAGAMLPAF
jgi:hypothetical protein